MTVLVVRTKVQAATVTRSIAGIRVFSAPSSNVGGIQVTHVRGTTGRAFIVSSRTTARLVVSEPTTAIKPLNVAGKIDLRVFRANDSFEYKWNSKQIKVMSVVYNVGSIRPVDENRLVTEPGKQTELTGVMLDLGMSFDTFFKFDMMSLDGIRVVLDEADVPITGVTDNKYALSNLVPGTKVKRTILTNNDFRVVLNINPTIVKAVN